MTKPRMRIEVSLQQFAALATLSSDADRALDGSFFKEFLGQDIFAQFEAARSQGQIVEFALRPDEKNYSADSLVAALSPKATRDRIAAELSETDIALIKYMTTTKEGRAILASSALDWGMVGIAPPWEGRI